MTRVLYIILEFLCAWWLIYLGSWIALIPCAIIFFLGAFHTVHNMKKNLEKNVKTIHDLLK